MTDTLPDIPEWAWQRNDPAHVVLDALEERAMTRTELEALCGGRCQLDRALVTLGDKIESTLWRKVRYYRIKPDGQGSQETIGT